MVAPRRGPHSRRGLPRAPLRWRGCPGLAGSGMGPRPGAGAPSKGPFKRELSPVGSPGRSEQESGPPTRPLAPRPGRPPSWAPGRGGRGAQSARLRLRTSARGAPSQQRTRPAGSDAGASGLVPGGASRAPANLAGPCLGPTSLAGHRRSLFQRSRAWSLGPSRTEPPPPGAGSAARGPVARRAPAARGPRGAGGLLGTRAPGPGRSPRATGSQRIKPTDTRPPHGGADTHTQTDRGGPHSTERTDRRPPPPGLRPRRGGPLTSRCGARRPRRAGAGRRLLGGAPCARLVSRSARGRRFIAAGSAPPARRSRRPAPAPAAPACPGGAPGQAARRPLGEPQAHGARRAGTGHGRARAPETRARGRRSGACGCEPPAASQGSWASGRVRGSEASAAFSSFSGRPLSFLIRRASSAAPRPG